MFPWDLGRDMPASASFDLSLQGYDRAYTKQFEQRVLEKVASLPGIESAGLINGLPLTLAISNCYIFVAEGKPLPARFRRADGRSILVESRIPSRRPDETHRRT
jgi:hypothetical protein